VFQSCERQEETMPAIRTAVLSAALIAAFVIPDTAVFAAASITSAQMPDLKCRVEANRKASAAATERVAYYDQCMARRGKGGK
jgi:hypothetical protein